MGRNRDDNKKRLILDRFKALQKEMTVGDGLIIDALAREFGVTANTIRYHMKTPGSGDMRRRYSDEELSKVALFSPSERKDYATRCGITTKNLRDALFSWNRRQRLCVTPLGNAATLGEVTARGYMNFSSRRDLAAVQLTLQDVRNARTAISSKYNLSLRAPNYIYHSKTRRYYALSLLEQIPFIKSPIKFLAERAAHIAANWVVKTAVEETAELYNNSELRLKRVNMSRARASADSLGFADNVRGTKEYAASTTEETRRMQRDAEHIVDKWESRVKDLTEFAEDTFTPKNEKEWGAALLSFEEVVVDG